MRHNKQFFKQKNIKREKYTKNEVRHIFYFDFYKFHDIVTRQTVA